MANQWDGHPRGLAVVVFAAVEHRREVVGPNRRVDEPPALVPAEVGIRDSVAHDFIRFVAAAAFLGDFRSEETATLHSSAPLSDPLAG